MLDPRRLLPRSVIGLLGLALFLAAACGDSGEPTTAPAAVTTAPVATTDPPATTVPVGCADVVAVEAERSADGTYSFDVTVSSADTGNEKYADAWEVRSVDGAVLGTRVLAHPHVGEQPFTRSLGGVAVPAGVVEVLVAARDSVVGFCGATVTVALPGTG